MSEHFVAGQLFTYIWLAWTFPAVALRGVVFGLASLQLLLLRGVALFHLLSLLLVALLHLLLLRFVCSLLRGSLMLSFLFLLKLLVFLILFCDQLVLLLLILLIEFGVAGVWWPRRLVRLNLACVIEVRRLSCCVGAIGWWMIGRSCFVSGDDVMAAELSRSRGCGDW